MAGRGAAWLGEARVPMALVVVPRFAARHGKARRGAARRGAAGRGEGANGTGGGSAICGGAGRGGAWRGWARGSKIQQRRLRKLSRLFLFDLKHKIG